MQSILERPDTVVYEDEGVIYITRNLDRTDGVGESGEGGGGDWTSLRRISAEGGQTFYYAANLYSGDSPRELQITLGSNTVHVSVVDCQDGSVLEEVEARWHSTK